MVTMSVRYPAISDTRRVTPGLGYVSDSTIQTQSGYFNCVVLTLKHQEAHGHVVSTVATDALVLKHQAISIRNADQIFISFDQFHTKTLHLWWTTLANKIMFWKKWPSRLRVKSFHVGQNPCLQPSLANEWSSPFEVSARVTYGGYQSICYRLTSWTLAQVMACCWKAPSHYLNQCWLFIKGVMWNLPDNNLTRSAHDISY